MIIPAICFIGGLVAMGRTKPQTAVRKMLCLGPRSGIVYNVEQLPEIRTFIVRAPNGSAVAQLIARDSREPGKPGLVWQNGQGHPDMLAVMRQDFAAELPKPVAVPKPEEKSA